MLEQGEIGHRGHRRTIDIFQRFFLIGICHFDSLSGVGRIRQLLRLVFLAQAGKDLVGIQLGEGDCLNRLAVFRAFYFIRGSKCAGIGFQRDGLRRVDSEINQLILQTEAVEIRILGTWTGKLELPIIRQSYRVEQFDRRDTYVFQIHNLPFGIRNNTLNRECLLLLTSGANGEQQRQSRRIHL